MASIRLTSGDVTALTGYTEKQLRNLCESGVLIPEQEGNGGGCFRLFSTIQVVAICFAARLGHSRELALKVFDAVLCMSESELRAKFRRGRTHLIPCIDGPMKLVRWQGSAEDGRFFDLKAVHEDATAAIAKLAAQHADAVSRRPEKRGRRRGLATAP